MSTSLERIETLREAIEAATARADENASEKLARLQAEQQRRGEIVKFLNDFQAQIQNDTQLKEKVEKLVSQVGEELMRHSGMGKMVGIPLLEGHQDNAPASLYLLPTGFGVVRIVGSSYQMVQNPNSEKDWERGRVFETGPDGKPYTVISLEQTLIGAIHKATSVKNK